MDQHAQVALHLYGDKLRDAIAKNLSGREIKALDIKIIVADPEWQAIRSKFVGTWKNDSEKNIKILKLYVGNMQDPYKVRRVLNYLTGTAFRIGLVYTDDIEIFRNRIRSAWSKLTA